MLTDLDFIVPAMSFDVMTTNSLGKKVKKLDAAGQVISVEKVVPKERPRFAGGHAFTPKHTVDFESWIRRSFFKTYPSGGGVYWAGKGWPVYDYFLGCMWPDEHKPCTRFRHGTDFLDCQACKYRRKNLSLYLEVHLKDERHLDLDNMIKIVLDALNRTFFYDDTQFIKKQVVLVPYSALGEHLRVKCAVEPPTFIHGSVVGGWAIKNMDVAAAKVYITELNGALVLAAQETADNGLSAQAAGVRATQELVAYVQRCDSRKYTQTLLKDLHGDG